MGVGRESGLFCFFSCFYVYVYVASALYKQSQPRCFFFPFTVILSFLFVSFSKKREINRPLGVAVCLSHQLSSSTFTFFTFYLLFSDSTVPHLGNVCVNIISSSPFSTVIR